MNPHTLGRAPYHHNLKRSTDRIHGEQLEDARVQCPLSTRKLAEAIGWVEVLREGEKLAKSYTNTYKINVSENTRFYIVHPSIKQS